MRYRSERAALIRAFTLLVLGQSRVAEVAPLSASEVLFVLAQLALLRYFCIVEPHDHLLELAVEATARAFQSTPPSSSYTPSSAAYPGVGVSGRFGAFGMGPLGPWRCRGGQRGAAGP